MKTPRIELQVSVYEMEAAHDQCSKVHYYLNTAQEAMLRGIVANAKINTSNMTETDVLIHVLSVGMQIAETCRAEDEAGPSL